MGEQDDRLATYTKTAQRAVELSEKTLVVLAKDYHLTRAELEDLLMSAWGHGRLSADIPDGEYELRTRAHDIATLLEGLDEVL